MQRSELAWSPSRSSNIQNIEGLNATFYEQGQAAGCEMFPSLPSSPQAISFLNGILER